MGEVGEQAPPAGYTYRAVQGDCLPDSVDVRCRDAVLPEQSGCQVGAFDLEPLLPGGAGAQPEIVHYARGEQQVLVVRGVAGAAVLAGEQPGEEERADAVVGDGRAFCPLRQGQGGAG